MANYFIIGSDGKQYGPVSDEDLRNWITEGRVSAQSQAAAEGATAWQPLSTLPEFADLFASTPSAAPATFQSGDRETALGKVKPPAIALIIAGSIGILYYIFNTVMVLTGNAGLQNQLPGNVPPQMQTILEGFNRGAHGPLPVIISLVIIAMNGFILFGGIKMLKLSNRNLAVAAAIVAMLPCQCCCLLGLPFGIWALVVLNKPEVKSQFE